MEIRWNSEFYYANFSKPVKIKDDGNAGDFFIFLGESSEFCK